MTDALGMERLEDRSAIGLVAKPSFRPPPCVPPFNDFPRKAAGALGLFLLRPSAARRTPEGPGLDFHLCLLFEVGFLTHFTPQQSS
jgi:hypothetical protein